MSKDELVHTVINVNVCAYINANTKTPQTVDCSCPNIHVYSPDIPLSSGDSTITLWHLKIWSHLFWEHIGHIFYKFEYFGPQGKHY